MARDNVKNTEVTPTEYEVRKVEGADGNERERPVPTEPHIGSADTSHTPKAAVQTLSVRGGTSRPPEGQSGEPAVVDEQGNELDISPGEFNRLIQEKGRQEAVDELTKKGTKTAKKSKQKDS